MKNCLLREIVQCNVIVYCLKNWIEDAAVAMIGIFTEAEIGYDKHIGMCFLDSPNRFSNDAVFAECVGADTVFGVGDTEENDCIDTQLLERKALINDLIDAHLVDTRHRRNLIFYGYATAGKKRIDKIIDTEMGLLQKVS